MIRSLFISAFLLVSIACFTSHANPFTLGERVEIDSKLLAQKRQLQILLPENYHAHLNASYPVIYLMDGDYNFSGVAGMLDLLANKGQRIPDVIVVAISDKGTDSYHKFTTPDGIATPRDDKVIGQAKLFLSFLTDEVQPFIEKKYRTSPHKSIVGHSMGGLFVLNALIEQPTSFNNYIAISPSVWLGDNAIVKRAESKLKISDDKPVSLFLSLGDETRMGQYDLLNFLDVNQPANLNWSFSHYDDENHNSVGLIALRNNLKTLFNAWYIPEKQLAKFDSATDIIGHYQQVMDEFDFQQSIPKAAIKAAIRMHYKAGLVQELPNFIQYASEQLPASKQAFIAMQASYAGHFDSPKTALALLKAVEVEFKHSIEHIKAIAGVYEQLADMTSAHHYYQRALVVAKQQKAQQWQVNILHAKIAATDK